MNPEELAELTRGENPWAKSDEDPAAQEIRAVKHDIDKRVERRRASYVFLDVVQFSKRTPEAQSEIVHGLNRTVLSALEEYDVKAEERLLLPTGDGLAIALLGDVFDLHLKLALCILKNVEEFNISVADSDLPHKRRFQIRIGLNQGTDILVTDINERPNLAGAAINLAFRIMDLADGGQILVGQQVYNDLQPSEMYVNQFRAFRQRLNTKRRYQFINS